MAKQPKILAASEADIVKMLGSSVHIGTRNLNAGMEQYIWKRRSDGVYLIDLSKTWEKLVLAARVIVAIENPEDVALVSMRPHGQRAVLKYCNYTGAKAMAGRFTPGTYTNQIQKSFVEPRLLVAQDPNTDHQPLREASYMNVPTIAFAHTDAPLRNVDIAIPCNNKGKLAAGIMYWFLAREVLRLRGSVSCRRNVEWSVMPDVFFYRNQEEMEADEQAALAQQAAAAAAAAAAPTEFLPPQGGLDVQGGGFLNADAAAFGQGMAAAGAGDVPGQQYWEQGAGGVLPAMPGMGGMGVPQMQPAGGGWDPSLMNTAAGFGGAPQGGAYQ